jgi:hypothetical protein
LAAVSKKYKLDEQVPGPGPGSSAKLFVQKRRVPGVETSEKYGEFGFIIPFLRLCKA